MSILQAFNQLNERFAPPTFGDSPAVSDAQDQRWYDAGLDILDAMLGAIRKPFRLGLATAAQRRSLLGKIVDTGRATLRGVSGLLTASKISLSEWFRQMKSGAMPRIYAGVMALLGPRDLPPIDRDAIRLEAVKQLSLLERFRTEILNAVVKLRTRDGAPNGSVEVRAALYASAAWPIAMNAEAARMAREGYTEERWVLGADDDRNCMGCPIQAARGFVPVGVLPLLGSQPCSVSCRCHKTYR